MTIVYARETYDQFTEDAKRLFDEHWQEVAQDKAEIPLVPDYEDFKRAEKIGMLVVVTARFDGKLVGYWVGFVKEHIHYKTTKMAFTDIYYLVPEFRGYARGLFKFLHAYLKGLGVVRLHNRAKTDDVNSAGRFLELMGYSLVEYGYSIKL